MNKNLHGLLRETLSKCRQSWRGLAAASLMPFLLAVIIGVIQVWQMRDINAAGLAASLSPSSASQANLQGLVEGHFLMFVGFFIFNMLVTIWHFTRIVHYWKNGAIRVFGLMPGELHETAAVVVYGLYVGVVLIAAYFVGSVALMLVSQFLTLAALPARVFDAVTGITALVLLVVMLGITLRFLVGFPAIAQGSTPRPMRDLWPLAKGLTFSLTWRCMVLIVGFLALSVLLVMLVLAPLLEGSENKIVDPTTHEPAANMARTIAAVLTPAVVMGHLAQACFLVLFSTLLYLAFGRLTAQNIKPKV